MDRADGEELAISSVYDAVKSIGRGLTRSDCVRCTLHWRSREGEIERKREEKKTCTEHNDALRMAIKKPGQ